MPYKTSGGKQCVVIGWEDCPCVQPFKLHCLPKDEERKRS